VFLLLLMLSYLPRVHYNIKQWHVQYDNCTFNILVWNGTKSSFQQLINTKHIVLLNNSTSTKTYRIQRKIIEAWNDGSSFSYFTILLFSSDTISSWNFKFADVNSYWRLWLKGWTTSWFSRSSSFWTWNRVRAILILLFSILRYEI